jgi:hypothetical protein
VSVTGDSLPQVWFPFDASGVPQTYANKSAIQAASWDFTWYDGNGVALSSQPTWTLPVAGVAGRHLISFVNPDGVWTVSISKPSTDHMSVPAEFSGEGFTYDTDALGALIQSSVGITVVDTLTEGTAEVFHGDSILLSFSVAESALAAIGASSLSDCDALKSEIKKVSTDSATAAEVTTLTESIFTDAAGDRIVRATLSAFPSAIAPPTGGQTTLACRADLRLTKGTSTITASTISLTVKWRATEP